MIEAMSNNLSSRSDTALVNAVNEVIHRASEELLGECLLLYHSSSSSSSS